MTPPDDTDTGSTFSPVTSLRADGTLEGRVRESAPDASVEADERPLELGRPIRQAPRPPPHEFGGAAPESLPSAFHSDEELELVPHVRHSDRARAPSAFLTPPPPEPSKGLSRALVRVLVLLVVAGLGYGVWQWFDQGEAGVAVRERVRAIASGAQKAKPAKARSAGFHQGTVLFLSSPDGALVTIDGEEIGETPFAGDLRWRRGAEITITRSGYAPWTGTLPPGPEVKLDVTLRRAPSR